MLAGMDQETPNKDELDRDLWDIRSGTHLRGILE